MPLVGSALPMVSDLLNTTRQRVNRYGDISRIRLGPEHFNDERAEHKQHSFCFHPFGGGAHKCIGMHFAYMIGKVCLFHLLRGSVLELPSNFKPKLAWIPIPRPVNGPPIALRKEKIR